MATETLVLAKPSFGRRLRESLTAYAFLAPATLFLVTFWLWPALYALFISMADYKISGETDFVFLDNYRWVLGNARFYRALMNTVNFVIYTVPTALALALFVAMLLNARIRGLGIFRTVYFLPYITSAVAVSAVWLYVFNTQFGLANSFLSIFEVPKVNWLNEPRGIYEVAAGWIVGDNQFRFGQSVTPDTPLRFMLIELLQGPSVSLLTIIIVAVWKSIGYSMVIFLAGLQGIDRTYYEAAEIDGASPWQKFWAITWPLISPYTFFLAIISTIFAFKEFIHVFIMTPNGGIEYDTATVIFLLFDLAFQGRFDLGRGAAVGFILFGILTVISLIQKFLIGSRVHYD